MTYIEFFDKNATDNICACLTQRPERVVMVGRDGKEMQRSVASLKRVLNGRGLKTEFIIRTVNPNNLSTVVSRLEEIVEQYGDCVVDLTGGYDLYLVALGIVFNKRVDKKIELIRFNVQSERVYDCDGNGYPKLSDFPKLRVDENITAYGGEVVWTKWDDSEELFADIEALWSICRRDVKKWNNLIAILEGAEQVSEADKPVETVARVSAMSAVTERLITKSTIDFAILDELREKGFIREYSYKDGTFRIKYKGAQVKRCLTKAGQVLEMKAYLSAIRATDEAGERVYNDVKNGVCIDWDGRDGDNDTENEIDVMMMHSLIPVFISCKNGFVSMDELYKLNTVAQRFGGRYAKKALIASALDLNGSFGRSFKMRADDMGIKVIANEIVNMTDEEINRKFRSFWNN